LIVVAILTVRKAAAEQFRAYEKHAAAVMAAHGGRIERTVVIDGSELFKEVHVVTFPGAAAFAAYRSDPRLAQMAHLRDESVLDTEILIGEEGPTYGDK
jgi:uncharacterized protein (DUF1330 family)